MAGCRLGCHTSSRLAHLRAPRSPPSERTHRPFRRQPRVDRRPLSQPPLPPINGRSRQWRLVSLKCGKGSNISLPLKRRWRTKSSSSTLPSRTYVAKWPSLLRPTNPNRRRPLHPGSRRPYADHRISVRAPEGRTYCKKSNAARQDGLASAIMIFLPSGFLYFSPTLCAPAGRKWLVLEGRKPLRWLSRWLPSSPPETCCSERKTSHRRTTGQQSTKFQERSTKRRHPLVGW